MKKIVYIVSSLPESGPTQQLLNIISSLNRENFSPVLVTLSALEPEDKSSSFEELDVEIHRLSLEGLEGIFPGKLFKGLIKNLKPDLIHSQGFRPDMLCMLCGFRIPRVLTIRNDPFKDYPSRYGALRGYAMALGHVFAIKSCNTPIACSKALKVVFKKYNVDAMVIRNGVKFDKPSTVAEVSAVKSSKTTFVTSGSLIPRKNIELLVSVFNSERLRDHSKLVVLGDGFLRSRCKRLASKNITFLGHRNDVNNHLDSSDFYISLSKSEGMPNGVLEALSIGLPCVLSNIGPHMEINELIPDATYLVDHTLSQNTVSEEIYRIVRELKVFRRNEIKSKALKVFDSQLNSRMYQNMYLRVLGVEHE